MNKIVLLTDCPERGNMLIECLRILFPECEIQVLSKQMGTFRDVQATSRFATVNPEAEK